MLPEPAPARRGTAGRAGPARGGVGGPRHGQGTQGNDITTLIYVMARTIIMARYREARAEVPDSFGLVANKIWKGRLVVLSSGLAAP